MPAIMLLKTGSQQTATACQVRENGDMPLATEMELFGHLMTGQVELLVTGRMRKQQRLWHGMTLIRIPEVVKKLK
jgi:hypothetical protein